jgi:hypothetical protein
MIHKYKRKLELTFYKTYYIFLFDKWLNRDCGQFEKYWLFFDKSSVKLNKWVKFELMKTAILCNR